MRVLEIGHTTATALCGYLLAGLGADVTKLVGPDPVPPDASDPVGLARWRTAQTVCFDQDKTVVAWTDAGSFDATAALAGVDVVIAGGDDGCRQMLGHDAASLRQAYPRAVIAVATELGRHGDYARLLGGDLAALALGGLLAMVGEPGREPLRVGGQQADNAAGLALFTAVWTGLFARTKTGQGALVETSAVRAVAYLDWKSQAYFADDGTVLRRGSTAGPVVLECADGHVGFYYRDEEWPAVKRLVGDARLDDPRFATQLGRDQYRDDLVAILSQFSRQVTRRDVYHASQALHIPAGPVLAVDELAADPQLRSRQAFAARPSPVGDIQLPRLPWTIEPATALAEFDAPAGRGSGGAGGPLAGLRVLDFGTITAGGRTSQFLGDFGAEVIKIEGPSRPDPFRHWSGVTGEAQDGDLASPPFRVVGRNKAAVAIDLKTADGVDLVRRLVEQADIVVENYRRGVMDKLGLSFDQLRAWNPAICLLSISSQGLTGPERDYVSFGGTLEALGGLMAVTGYGPAEPVWTTAKVNYPDQAVAVLAPGLALATVISARQTGQGVHCDLSQRDTVVTLISPLIALAALTGQRPMPAANLAAGELGFCLPARGQDQWIALSLTTESQWLALLAAAGRTDLAQDARFARPADRVSQRAGLIDELADWSAGLDKTDLMWRLQAVGVPAAAVLRGWELPAETSRAEVFHVPVPTIDGPGESQVSWPFVIDTAAQPGIGRRAPQVGQDTVAVLRRAGIDDDRLARLLAAGVIWAAPDRAPAETIQRSGQ